MIKQFNLAWVICLHAVKMYNSSIWPIDRKLSGATMPGQNWPESSETVECYICCILTFDLARHAIPKTAEVHIPLA